jgi:hypothetical protein
MAPSQPQLNATEQCREPERRSSAVLKWKINRRRPVTADVIMPRMEPLKRYTRISIAALMCITAVLALFFALYITPESRLGNQSLAGKANAQLARFFLQYALPNNA